MLSARQISKPTNQERIPTNMKSKLNSIKVGQLASTLANAFKSNFSKLLLVGSVGVGKTASVLSAWKKIAPNIDGDPEVLVENISTASPEDLRGLPVNVNGKAVFLPLRLTEILTTAKRPKLVFLDDLGCAPTSVQCALLHLIHGGVTEAGRVSEHIRFIGATNDKTHRAGVNGIIAPLTGRFSTILEVEPDLDSWSEWALGEGNLPAEVVSAVRFRPELFAVEQVPQGITKFHCPRSWEHAGRLIQDGVTDLPLLAGTLGDEAGLFLSGFVGIYKTLAGLPDKVLLDPKGTPIPEKYEHVWALAGALISRATASTFAPIAQFAKRIGCENGKSNKPEIEAFIIRGLLLKGGAEISSSNDFVTWSLKEAKRVLGA